MSTAKRNAATKQIDALRSKLQVLERKNPSLLYEFLKKWNIPSEGDTTHNIIETATAWLVEDQKSFYEFVDDLDYVDNDPAVGADDSKYKAGSIVDSVVTTAVETAAEIAKKKAGIDNTETNTTTSTTATNKESGESNSILMYVLIGVAALIGIGTLVSIFKKS